MAFDPSTAKPDSEFDPSTAQPDERRSSAPKKKLGWQDALAGPDIMATLASGAVAGPLSGLAGIVGSVLPGPAGQGADWQKRTAGALSFEPRTRVGQEVTSAAALPFEALAKGAEAVGRKSFEAGLEPAGATAVQTAIEAAPALLLGAAGRTGKQPKVAAAEMRNEVRDATYAAATSEGYKFPPSATSDSMLNRRVEGMAGRPMLNQEAILNNQSITNKIAAREAGLPENTAITPGRLEARRKELAAPYREVSAIDASVAEDLVALREARSESQKWYRFYESHPNPMVEKKAKRFADKAELLEGYIEDAAKQAGKPDLVDRLRQSRKEIAKTYDIESALNEGSADISAAKFGAMLDRGKPLSGGLETIAKAHQAFRPYMQNATSIKNPGVERSRGAIGLAANAAGIHGGFGWLSEGIPFASGPTRSLLLSDVYQSGVGQPRYGTPALTPEMGVLEGILAQQQGRRK